ncbi:SPOR domain-containing protein [Candidatus Marithrix sp. Canyon 246]|uniref:SPOR domain-containing protein n=1 Tax=Candidatus Marithrix sp. Canyon 246 TaxID=1827136 RepID=UPI00084A2BA7|nr:SPOR domain-containing protein [Candidatus Marithrix sp. Canyon 246]
MATRRRRTQQNSCPPGWTWLLVGFFMGVFVSFLFYLQKTPPQKATIPAPVSEKPLPYGKFEFYYPSVIKTETNKPVTELVTNPGRYLLQVGSYREQDGAEGLKRHIESFGITTNIAKTNLTNKGRWYRVQIGPFTDLNKLNQTSAKLKANGINAIVRKY